jgi:hypothetical protein
MRRMLSLKPPRNPWYHRVAIILGTLLIAVGVWRARR